jgi:hypothetical protein
LNREKPVSSEQVGRSEKSPDQEFKLNSMLADWCENSLVFADRPGRIDVTMGGAAWTPSCLQFSHSEGFVNTPSKFLDTLLGRTRATRPRINVVRGRYRSLLAVKKNARCQRMTTGVAKGG